MKLIMPALAAVIGASPASVLAAQPAPAPPTTAPQQTLAPSKSAAKAIIDLNAAVKANDRASIPAKIAAAEAVATTKNDRYLIGTLRLKAAVAANDDAQLLAAADAIAASNAEQPAKVASIYNAIGAQLYQNKQFAQAATAFGKAIVLNPTDSTAVFDLGQAQMAAGQATAAAATYRKAISAASAGGQKPSEDLYNNAVIAAYKAHLPEAFELTRGWVAAYPTTANWHDAIAIYRNEAHPDEQASLDLLRLLQAVGALKPEDYRTFIEATSDQLNFNEAQKVYDAGVAIGAVDAAKPDATEIRNFLKVKAKATPADLDAAIKMSPNATNLLRIGDRFYAMGDYARAAQVYRDVMNKPGADRDLASLHLGMALARSGDKPGATVALNAVTGARADIAKYWLLYVQQKA